MELVSKLPEPVATPLEIGVNMRSPDGRRVGVYYCGQPDTPGGERSPVSRANKARKSQPLCKYGGEIRPYKWLKKIWLGRFNTEEEAMIRYDIARKCVGRPTIHYSYHPNYFRPFQYRNKTYKDQELEQFLEDAAPKDSDPLKRKSFKDFVKAEGRRIMALNVMKNFLEKRIKLSEYSGSQGAPQPQLELSVSTVSSYTGLNDEDVTGSAPVTSAVTTSDSLPAIHSSTPPEPEHVVSGMLSELPGAGRSLELMNAISGGSGYHVPQCELGLGEMEAMPTGHEATGVASMDPSFMAHLRRMEAILNTDDDDMLPISQDATGLDSSDPSFMDKLLKMEAFLITDDNDVLKSNNYSDMLTSHDRPASPEVENHLCSVGVVYTTNVTAFLRTFCGMLSDCVAKKMCFSQNVEQSEAYILASSSDMQGIYSFNVMFAPGCEEDPGDIRATFHCTLEVLLRLLMHISDQCLGQEAAANIILKAMLEVKNLSRVVNMECIQVIGGVTCPALVDLSAFPWPLQVVGDLHSFVKDLQGITHKMVETWRF